MALSQSEQILIDLNRQILQSTQDMAKAMSGVTNYTKQANEALGSVNRNSNSAQKTFSNINAEAENLGKELSSSNKESGKLKEAFKDIGNTIRSMTGLTSGFIAALGIGQTIIQVGDLRQEFLKLSKNMAMGRGEMEQLSDSVLRVQTATGESLSKLQAMGATLIKMRVSVKDFGVLLKTTQEFSRATGVSDAAAAKLVGQLNRMGKMGNDSIRKVIGSIAQVQKSFGMTSEEAEGLTDSLLLATQRLKQMGSSSGQIENFSKGTMKLAAAFSSVGVEAGEAAKIIDRLLDPGAIEDNALLFAKLGVGIGDAINGSIDPGTLISGFKNLGQEMSSMTGPAAAALSRELGMSLTDIRQMADMNPQAIAEKFGLASDASAVLTEQANGNRDVMDNISQIWDSIKGTIGSVVNAIMPMLVPLLEKINKIVKNLGTNVESGLVQNLKKGTMWVSNFLDKLLNGGGIDGFIEQIKKIPEMFQQAVKFFQDLPALVGKIGPMLMMLVPMLANIFGGGIKKAFSTNVDSISQTMSDAVSTGYVKGIEKGNLVQAQKAGGGGIKSGNQELISLSKTINSMDYDIMSAEKNSGLLFGWSKKIAEQAERIHKNTWETNKGFGSVDNIMTNIARKNSENYDISVRTYESNIALGAAKIEELKTTTEDLNKRRLAGEVTEITYSRLLKDIKEQTIRAKEFHDINLAGSENYKASMEKYMSKAFWQPRVDAAEAIQKAATEELKIAKSTALESQERLITFNKQFASSVEGLENELKGNLAAQDRIEKQKMLNDLQEQHKLLAKSALESAEYETKTLKDQIKATEELNITKGKQEGAKGGFGSNVMGVLTNFGEKFRNSLDSVGNNLKSVLKDGWKGLGNTIKDGAKKFGGVMAKAAGPLMLLGMFLGPLLDMLKEPLQQFADAFREGLAPVMKALLPVVITLLNQVLMPLVKTLLPPLLKLLSLLIKALGVVVGAIGTAFGNDALKNVGKSMADAADTMWDASEKMSNSVNNFANLEAQRVKIIEKGTQITKQIFGDHSGTITKQMLAETSLSNQQITAINENITELNKNTIQMSQYKAQEQVVDISKKIAEMSTAGVGKDEIKNTVMKMVSGNSGLTKFINSLGSAGDMIKMLSGENNSSLNFGQMIRKFQISSSDESQKKINELIANAMEEKERITTESLKTAGVSNENLLTDNQRNIMENAINAGIAAKALREKPSANILGDFNKIIAENMDPNALLEKISRSGSLEKTTAWLKTLGVNVNEGTPGSTAVSDNQTVYSSTGSGAIAEEQRQKTTDYQKRLVELQEAANKLAEEQLAQIIQTRIDGLTREDIRRTKLEEIVSGIRSGTLNVNDANTALVGIH